MTGSAGSTSSTSSRAGALVLLLAWGVARCGSAPPNIDLVAALPTAERHALAPPDTAIRATVVSRDRADRPAIVTDAPARVVFPVNMPARAHFRAAVALQSPAGSGVTVRLGIADNRSYEELLKIPIDPPAPGADPWRAIDVDLRAYSGWQWSLFYRPSRITWKLVLNADATPGGSVVWLQPTIDMRD